MSQKQSGQPRAHSSYIEIVRCVEDLPPYIDAWQDLADNAVEHNIFYEPWNLLPALRNVARDKHFSLVFIFRGERADRRLIGLFPFERRRRYKFMPIRHLRMLRHLHCFLCTPLLRRDCEAECLTAFANWAETSRPLLEFARISTTMRVRLERSLRGHLAVSVAEQGDRAFFRPQQDAESYLSEALPKKKRKDLRRKLRRLSECGELTYRSLRADEDATPWIDSFLELERRGWKGRARTALACRPGDRDYFVDSALRAHEAGKLAFIGYFLDGEPVALSCKFLAGSGAFAFKITFDEEYSRYSPGMLLELRYIILAHENASIDWMDSCADPDHFMANRLWVDRCGIETMVITQGLYSRGISIFTQALRSAIQPIRNFRLSRRMKIRV